MISSLLSKACIHIVKERLALGEASDEMTQATCFFIESDVRILGEEAF